MVIRYHPGRPGPIRPTTSGLNLLPVGTAGALPQAIAIAAGRWLGRGRWRCSTERSGQIRQTTTAEVRLDEDNQRVPPMRGRTARRFGCYRVRRDRIRLPRSPHGWKITSNGHPKPLVSDRIPYPVATCSLATAGAFSQIGGADRPGTFCRRTKFEFVVDKTVAQNCRACRCRRLAHRCAIAPRVAPTKLLLWAHKPAAASARPPKREHTARVVSIPSQHCLAIIAADAWSQS